MISFIMPEVALKRLLDFGLTKIKSNPVLMDEIFAYYNEPENQRIYGQDYIDKIKRWVVDKELPVVQSWSLTEQRIPCISIQLSSDTEDVGNEPMGDFLGNDYQVGEDTGFLYGTVMVNTSLNIGIITDKSSEYVLWLYYIVIFILYKYRTYGLSLGLNKYTFTGTDIDKMTNKGMENVYSRFIRFNTLVQHNFTLQESYAIDAVEAAILKERSEIV